MKQTQALAAKHSAHSSSEQAQRGYARAGKFTSTCVTSHGGWPGRGGGITQAAAPGTSIHKPRVELNAVVHARRTVSRWAGQAHQRSAVDVTDTTLKPQHFLTFISTEKHLWVRFPTEKILVFSCLTF